MKAKVLQGMDPLELLDKEKELKKELFHLRFQLATGKIENPARIRNARREIARVRTIYHQKIQHQNAASSR